MAKLPSIGGAKLRQVPLSSRLALVLGVALLAVAGLSVQACSSSSAEQHVAGKPVRAYTSADAPEHMAVAMPSFVTAEVRDGYEYALAHPDQLQYIPCYCGCGLTAGHKNNADCYVAGIDQDDKVVFDNHATFCSVCLEITRDVKRLSAEGKSLRDIRAYVDHAHGEKGPATDTPLPPL